MLRDSNIIEFLLSKGVHQASASKTASFVISALNSGGYNGTSVKSQSVSDGGLKYSAVLSRNDDAPFTVAYECRQRTAGLYEHFVQVSTPSGDGFSVSTLESRQVVTTSPIIVRPVAPPTPPTPVVEKIVVAPEPEPAPVEEVVVVTEDNSEPDVIEGVASEVETVAEGDEVDEVVTEESVKKTKKKKK